MSLQANRFAKAEARCRSLLQSHPDDHQALYYLGIAMLGQGRLTEALENLQHALRFAPANGDYWLKLTEVLLELERPAEALDILDDLIGKGLDWPSALDLKTRAEQALRQVSEREIAREQAIQDARDGPASNLCVGGTEAKPGWLILNIQPGPDVDEIGDIRDLSMFADQCFEEVYASHVLEHVPQQFVIETLQGLYRILKPNGRVMISVPDMDVLCRGFLSERFSFADRVEIMRMMFGGQVNEYDFHFVGFNYEILSRLLTAAGFSRVRRVERFGLFLDTSDCAPYGEPISLNLIAFREA
ncbi:tetratricopeptide repeat protein [Thiorhodovibrio frisius]|uniref:tetratricopeptide repeat protein n=1 Tax=Thiorhodovibrio frisius TaxID=631362 RepID=UPI00167F6B01